MNKVRIFLTALIGLSIFSMFIPGFSQTELSNEELLKEFDQMRFLEPGQRQLTVTLESKTNEGEEKAKVILYFKEINGEDYTKIEFLEPEETAGQIYLVTPDGTYFWQPELDSPIKTTASRSVFADAPVAQTIGIRFVENYSVKGKAETNLEDGSQVLKVDLEAKDPTVAFQSVTIQADVETLKPLVMNLNAISGTLLRRVIFHEYGELEGDSYVKIHIVENALIEGKSTKTEIVEIASDNFPDDFFYPGSLGNSE